ncbi:hypothetical protein [Mitsuaria sp. GD03876]|uniref:hypothetical protein n=1 Tax=Mitsuaria sp. GD03876 TaxID=2975399 RepID=UPI00244D7928|nr:hypothetical protein [Mitsuaria sp. GD03876]MDH0866648.1 hypothetical protein [Mitsuaria sp. GD03876]
MQPAHPQTIARQLDAQLASIESRIGHFLDPAHAEIRSLLASADQLAGVDAAEASHVRGRIHTLTGDRRQVDYWFANARRLCDEWRVDFNHASCLASLGYFSDAAAMTKRFLSSSTGALSLTVGLAVSVLDLSGAQEAYAALRRAGIPPRGHDPNFTLTAVEVLAYYRIPIERARIVLDVAGELLREHRLWWLGGHPKLFAHRSLDDAGVLYELRVGLPSEDSLRLNDQLIERLVDRSLLLPGFSFSFIGAGAIAPIPSSPRLTRIQ